MIGRHGSNGAAVCGVQVSVPASSSLDWQDRGPEGQLEAKWAAGRDSRTHPPLGFSPSFRGFLFWARGSGLPLTREARETPGPVQTAPELQPGLEGGPESHAPGHSGRCVLGAGLPAWLFWSLPGLCQIPTSPRTSPKGLRGGQGPHFLPGQINQLSNCPDA